MPKLIICDGDITHYSDTNEFTCSGTWQTVEYVEQVDTTIDPFIATQAFSGGFVLIATFWALGYKIRVGTRNIKRA